MMLYVRGTDIKRLTLAGLSDDRARFVVDPVVHDSAPEAYLSHAAAFLREHPDQLTGIVAVLGPGSATALRTSLTMVNTLAFTMSLPCYGISLAPESDDREALVALCGADVIPMARPIYQNEARITPSAKDVLHRR